MTYFRFHLLFVVPWVLVGILGQLASWQARGVPAAVAITLLIVYAFTCPWDNWAVKRGIWGFPPGRYSFRIVHLPIEEYAFFGLQSLIAIGALLALEQRVPQLPWALPRPPLWACGMVVGLWAVVGRWLWRRSGPVGRRAYAFHMFFWMLPVAAIQWVLGPDLLAPRMPLILVVTGLVGGYLTVADLFAVRWGLWHFDEHQITGVKLGGILPWEEAVFFFLTSLLVAQSFILWRSLGLG